MKAITKYQADDGTEFDTAEKALAHDALVIEVAGIMGMLQPRPTLPACGFENGHGFIRHPPVTLERVRMRILRVAQRFTDHKWLQQTIDDPEHAERVHPSYAGRIISDCCPRPVDRAWYRIMCIDKQGREWCQPYYANNPEKAEPIDLTAGEPA